jgi:hypothetical protein
MTPTQAVPVCSQLETLTDRATRYAICTWKLMPPATIRATYPGKLAPDTLLALDELTSAGLLTRTNDPRGTAVWKPTAAMRTFVAAHAIPADTLISGDTL